MRRFIVSLSITTKMTVIPRDGSDPMMKSIVIGTVSLTAEASLGELEWNTWYVGK